MATMATQQHRAGGTDERRAVRRRWCPGAACGLLAVLLATAPAAAAEPTPRLAQRSLVVALKPDKNPDAMVAEKAALAAYLSQALGVPVEVIIPLAGATIIEGFANGTVDLGYLSSSEMLLAGERGVATLLLAGEIDGQTHYESYWLARADAPYAGVADLRGRPVAFASKTSTSGYRIPLADLYAKGLLAPGQAPEAFFGAGHVWFGTGYVSAVERVLNGDAAAAAVSDYVLDGDKHLSPEQRAQLKVVARQGPVPTHVIAVRSSLPAADRDAVRDALEAMNDGSHAALRDRVFTSRLVRVDADRHLAPLVEANRAIGEGS